MRRPRLRDRRPLGPESVIAVYRALLRRDPAAGEIGPWLRVRSLEELIAGVLASEEYAQLAARREEPPATLNCWIEGLERFAPAPGTMSVDGVAIVGEQGHLFLCGGSNSNLAMFEGRLQLAPGWLDAWRELLAARRQGADRPLACLVVPDKLAVYGEHYPGGLGGAGSRPVLELLAEGSLIYPDRTLIDGRTGGDTYLRTDSHLTPHGNRLLAEATLAALGVEQAPPSPAQSQYVTSGDLGRHFDPAIVEIAALPSAPSRAAIVQDNWPQVRRAGGHIGTRRVFRNEAAPDPRTIAVFGDSYGFGDDAYPGLSWFLAQIFAEVHFLWVPFGWDPRYLDDVGADLVVCETAERFMGRVPQREVDVRALAARGSSALGLENAFAL